MSDVTPPLPEKQTKVYPSELMENYADRFGLTAGDLKETRFQWLVKAKIDSDIFIGQQSKRIAALETKIAGLLEFVRKVANVKKLSTKEIR